ncbi:hydrogenase maturation protease [Myxosarcina sp. GI1(2024)]
MVKSLVVGYGNDLRGDDGIGTQVAQIVATWHLPRVRSLPLHQLFPELAADLASVDLVIFVDACRAFGRDSVELYSLKPVDATKLESHFSDPIAILSLTQSIYEKCPQAWWVVVPGVNFTLGDRLSVLARDGISQALIQIRNLISAVNSQTEVTSRGKTSQLR